MVVRRGTPRPARLSPSRTTRSPGADAPDYRHRCFAAAEPEPRGHPAPGAFLPYRLPFAQCPIFLDWARQEAAGVLGAASAAAAAGAAASAGESAADAGQAAAETPAFLAGTAPNNAGRAAPITAHSTSDPGSGLWGFEGAPKRTVAPATSPATASSSPAPGTAAYAMARASRAAGLGAPAAHGQLPAAARPRR